MGKPELTKEIETLRSKIERNQNLLDSLSPNERQLHAALVKDMEDGITSAKQLLHMYETLLKYINKNENK